MAVAHRMLGSSLFGYLQRTPIATSFAQTITARPYPLSYTSLISASISIPSISINIPGLLSDIWDGLLKAVPKKKTSHMKKRHRQLAGKALKDVKAVNSCPGCGRPKKAHTLCPFCVAEIQQSWKQAAKRTAAQGVAP